MISGLGVALLYRYSLGADLRARKLAVLDVNGLPRDGEWHLMRPALKARSGIAQIFVAFAREEARRIFDERLAEEASPVASEGAVAAAFDRSLSAREARRLRLAPPPTAIPDSIRDPC
jgi:hypothetical protein